MPGFYGSKFILRRRDWQRGWEQPAVKWGQGEMDYKAKAFVKRFLDPLDAFVDFAKRNVSTRKSPTTDDFHQRR